MSYSYLYTNYGNLCIIIINYLRMFFISLFTFYTSLKLSNHTINKHFNIFILINLIFSACLSLILNYSSTFYTTPIIALFSFLSFLIINNFKVLHSAIVTFLSLCINFIILLICSITNYIMSSIFNIHNAIISFILIFSLYAFLLYSILKLSKFKYGVIFINKTANNENIDLIILNISMVLFLFFVLLPRMNYYFTQNIIFIIAFFSVIMAITIYKSFSLYYKHNLLVKELNDTKLELEKKDKEIERLEKENLEFSKTSHSIAHKQRVLEYKLNQLQLNTEFANELDLSDKLKEISDTYSSNVTNLTLPKTGIENIDDILEYMQSECTKNNINFELQLNGDIFSMVTTVINKEKLEILLADHIKNAIIAINSSKNINKSILVRLGLINDIYSIYFYDSGIEFDENVLSSLGKEQITTHKDIGGTGCGFLNTFDTLKEFNASLEINEISAPCKDNYTKSIVIKFDGKNDFEINSYKKQE